MLSALARTARDERGIALPMALFTLLLLTSLSLAFLTLGQTEPVVSNNHMRSAQARVLAEAGVERALWALTNTTTSGIASPYPVGLYPSPYNGLTYFTVTNATGGFTVKLTGIDQFTVTVETEGWVPAIGRSTVTGYNASDTRTKAHRKILMTAIRYPNFAMGVNCALCVKGDLVVKGNSSINSLADTSCGNKFGVTSAGTLCLGGDNACSTADPNWGNNGSINGATGTSASDNDTSDYASNAGTSTFDNMQLGAGQLEALKQLAKEQGTYYTGNTTFNAGNRIPANTSIVFVEGNLFTTGFPYVGNVYTGWIIVTGSAAVNGNGTLNGMLYALDDITSTSGTNVVNGLVIAQNTNNTSGIDSDAAGTMTINWNCNYANGNNQFPLGWFPRLGSWSEPSG